MFRVYIKTAALADAFRASDYMPDRRSGFILVLIGLGLGLFQCMRVQNKKQQWIVFVSLVTTYVGLHFLTSFFVDEVFVNLEHTWNLLHFGRFSFDPNKIVGGTVEMLYYFLLTPFAGTHGLLVAATYAAGLLIGLLHLVLVWRMTAELSPNYRWLVVLIFLSNIPMMATFSSGFGNPLVSLISLYAFQLARKQRIQKAAMLVAFLPLVRIDAILVTFWFILALVTSRSSINQIKSAVVVSIGCLMLNLGFCQWYYGNAILTPVLFKSGFDLFIDSLDLWPVWVAYLRESATPVHLMAMLSTAILISQSGMKRLEVRLAVFGLPVQLFYWFSTNTQYYSLTRYWISMEVIWTVLVLLLFQELILKCRTNSGNTIGPDSAVPRNSTVLEKLQACSRRAAVPIAACITLISTIILDIHCWGHIWALKLPPVCWPYSVAGELTDRLVPQNWTIAAHELNQFGFVMDRSIIDLWGYTDRQTAGSNTRNARGIKTRPGLFLEIKPDVHWSISDSTDLHFNFAQSNTERPEAFLAGLANWGSQLSNLGPLVPVLKEYDSVLLKEGHVLHLFMIRKDRMIAFEEFLILDGFKKKKDWQINLDELQLRLDGKYKPKSQVIPD